MSTSLRGRDIRAKRKRIPGFYQRDLARELGLNRQTVADLENERVHDPSVLRRAAETLERIHSQRAGA